MLLSLAPHPDMAKLPLERMPFDVGGSRWQMDVVRDEAAQMGITPDRDDYPFGLMIWESAIVLSQEMAKRGAALKGQTILELGCGVGLPGMIARRFGGRVVQTDHDALALALCRHNAALNGVGGIEQFCGDWRDWTHTGRYDLVIGADIIYDTADYALLEQVFRSTLAPSGLLLLTDPQRQQTIALFTIMEDAGWRIETTELAVPAIVPVTSAKSIVDIQIVTATLRL